MADARAKTSDRRGAAHRGRWQLRHEAGLRAGAVLTLEPGRYEIRSGAPEGQRLGPEPNDVAFVIELTLDGATVAPRRRIVHVDGKAISRPATVGDGQFISVDGDGFVLVDARVRQKEHARLSAPVLPPPPAGQGRRRRRAVEAEQRERRLRRFGLDVDDAARAEVRRRRKGVGLPSEVGRASNSGRALELRDHQRIAVAVAVEPERFWPDGLPSPLPVELRAIVEQRSHLSGVPITVDLTTERLGVVGSSGATTAVRRHLLLAHTAADPARSTREVADYITTAASLDELEADACDVILEIDDDGTARLAKGSRPSRSVLPIGCDPPRATELARALVQRNQPTPPPASSASSASERDDAATTFTQGAVLVSGDDRRVNTNILASLALDVLERADDRRLELFVIDRPDRALIRLAQLRQTRRYVSGDNPDAIEQALNELEAATEGPRRGTSVLLTNELGPLISFLNDVGRPDLVTRLAAAIAAHDRAALLVAASGPDKAIDELPAELFVSQLHCGTTHAHLTGPSGKQTLALGHMAQRDLTAAVAELVTISR